LSKKKIEYLLQVYDSVEEKASWLLSNPESTREGQKIHWFMEAVFGIFGVDESNPDEWVTAILPVFNYGKNRERIAELLVEKLRKGKILKNWQKTWLVEMESLLRNPRQGVELISLMNISFSQYDMLTQIYGKTFDEDTNRMKRQHLSNGESIGFLLATKRKVQALWKEIIEKNLKYRKIEFEEYTGYIWPIPYIIQYILSHSLLTNLMKDSTVLDIILKLDGFPVGGEQGFCVSITLKNFGFLAKCGCLHFLTNIADISDKDRNLVKIFLAENLVYLNEIASTGFLFLPDWKIKVACSLRIGGDDPMLRVLMGLDSSISSWLCIYCFQLRNGKDQSIFCNIMIQLINKLIRGEKNLSHVKREWDMGNILSKEQGLARSSTNLTCIFR
jgi:hypothetical protein